MDLFFIGTRMDVIGASCEADIPETEQLAGNNSEGFFLKLITSGAHLYNKPVITQESFVFRGLSEMTTPQKMRLLADKSFAAGVNQVNQVNHYYVCFPEKFFQICSDQNRFLPINR
jgi:hypothetical protein